MVVDDARTVVVRLGDMVHPATHEPELYGCCLQGTCHSTGMVDLAGVFEYLSSKYTAGVAYPREETTIQLMPKLRCETGET